MEAQDIVEMLIESGFVISVCQDKLLVSPPSIPEGIASLIKTKKNEIMRLLTQSESDEEPIEETTKREAEWIISQLKDNDPDKTRLQTLLTATQNDGATDWLPLMIATVETYTRRINPTWKATTADLAGKGKPQSLRSCAAVAETSSTNTKPKPTGKHAQLTQRSQNSPTQKTLSL